MQRYVIERDFGQIDEAEMQAAAVRAKRTDQKFPDVTWEHSHVCADQDGQVTSFCVYAAPDEQRIRDHAEAFGGHTVKRIYEVVGDVMPDGVPD